MATNELDGCIQIQFEFLWQTLEQKDIFGTSKQFQGRLYSTVRYLITIQHLIIILGVTTAYYLSFLNF